MHTRDAVAWGAPQPSVCWGSWRPHSAPRTAALASGPACPYSLGVRGVPEAQDGKVHPAEGSRRQVLPEYEPPEALRPEAAGFAALPGALRATGGGSCAPARGADLRQGSISFCHKGKKRGRGRKPGKAAPEPAPESAGLRPCPGGGLRASPRGTGWRGWKTARSLWGGHCPVPPTSPKADGRPCSDLGPLEGPSFFTPRAPCSRSPSALGLRADWG